MSHAVAIPNSGSAACCYNAPDMLLSKSLPPSYTPSQPAPLYSDSPISGEQSLQYTPRVGGSWMLPQSHYVKRVGKTTIVLDHQEEDARIPQYRQTGIISGYIQLLDVPRVSEVTLSIEGRLDVSMAEGTNSATIKTLHSSVALWKRPRPNATTESGSMPTICPSQLDFAFALPSEYEDSTGCHPLPPSFQTPDVGHSQASLFARSSYRIHVTIKRTPKLGGSLAMLEKTKHVFRHEFLALIKTIPDEWYQSTTSIDVPSPQGVDGTFQPVTANMLVPNPRVYALSDSIPFHLQLSGRVDSLRALVAPDTLSEDTLSDNRTSAHCPKASSRQRHCIKRLQGEVGTSLRVFLLRQVRLELKGKIRVQNIIIGEAQLDAVPPVLTDGYRPPVVSGSSEEYLSWTGRLQCGKGMDKFLREHPWQACTNVTFGRLPRRGDAQGERLYRVQRW
ncbi:hypothetical protein BKA70DRAFT_1435042 [Coprinopsis sp. MPI-PUGE-AT-0042]|nr:hypothetical protein BKA70DRAFT_1435042 [Coprinopsis sp. MPI-PUGE-AT-0042]